MALRWLWTQVENMGPGQREYVAMAWHPNGTEVILFGGFTQSVTPTGMVGRFLSDTWSWDGSHWAQVQDVGPPSRAGAALAPDRSGGLLLSGGRAGNTVRRDTWLWDGAGWTQVADSGPVADWHEPAASYDPKQQMTVLVSNPIETVTETWYWDGSWWTQVQDQGPVMTSKFLAWDATAEQMVLCGNEPDKSVATTYVWAQYMWVQANDMGPADGIRGVFSSPAGVLARTESDTWLWDGQKRRWTRVQDMGGKAANIGTAWDSLRGVGLMFVGASGDTWKLTPP